MFIVYDVGNVCFTFFIPFIKMNITSVFWDVKLYILVGRYHCVKGIGCFHLLPCRWRHLDPPKHWCLSTKLHGINFQNTVLFIVIAVITPNLTGWHFMEQCSSGLLVGSTFLFCCEHDICCCIIITTVNVTSWYLSLMVLGCLWKRTGWLIVCSWHLLMRN